MSNKRRKFSDQIRDAIEKSEFTRYRIGQLAQIDQSVLTRFVNGERGMSLESLDRLADVLQLEITAKGSRKQEGGK